MSTNSENMKRLWRVGLLLSLVLLAYLAPRPQVTAQSANPFITGQISVAATVTNIVGGDGARTGLLITNPGTVGVYIGASGVTTATGAWLPGGGSISIPTRAPVYGISSGAAQNVTFLVTYE